jgi:hypothetical protein
MMWQGPTLGGYSKWVPAAEPGLAVCSVRVVVEDHAGTTATITGFPRHPKPQALERVRPCLR